MYIHLKSHITFFLPLNTLKRNYRIQNFWKFRNRCVSSVNLQHKQNNATNVENDKKAIFFHYHFIKCSVFKSIKNQEFKNQEN